MDRAARPSIDPPPIVIAPGAVGVLVPFAIVGTLAILAGGSIAAAARPAGWDQGSWAAAYLVLPAGLGTWVGGLALGFLPDRRAGTAAPEVRAPWFLTAWVLGNTGVLVGNLLDLPLVLGLGALVLLGVLIASALVLRSVGSSGPWLRAYLIGVVVLVVSVPIGLLLSAR